MFPCSIVVVVVCIVRYSFSPKFSISYSIQNPGFPHDVYFLHLFLCVGGPASGILHTISEDHSRLRGDARIEIPWYGAAALRGYLKCNF